LLRATQASPRWRFHAVEPAAVLNGSLTQVVVCMSCTYDTSCSHASATACRHPVPPNRPCSARSYRLASADATTAGRLCSRVCRAWEAAPPGSMPAGDKPTQLQTDPSCRRRTSRVCVHRAGDLQPGCARF
jgi:hypothetical protein